MSRPAHLTRLRPAPAEADRWKRGRRFSHDTDAFRSSVRRIYHETDGATAWIPQTAFARPVELTPKRPLLAERRRPAARARLSPLAGGSPAAPASPPPAPIPLAAGPFEEEEEEPAAPRRPPP
jgi:hypothetical protein